jgi:hypothetical protein
MLLGGNQMAGLGSQAQTQLFGDASALENIGATQRGLTQRGLDYGYQDFRDSQNYPYDILSRGSSIVNAQQLPQNTYGQTQTAGGGPSTLAQVAGGAAGLAGLYMATRRAKGGAVRKPKSVSSYGKLPKRGLGAMMMEAA